VFDSSGKVKLRYELTRFDRWPNIILKRIGIPNLMPVIAHKKDNYQINNFKVGNVIEFSNPHFRFFLPLPQHFYTGNNQLNRKCKQNKYILF
jgi:hypothetical protein